MVYAIFSGDTRDSHLTWPVGRVERAQSAVDHRGDDHALIHGDAAIDHAAADARLPNALVYFRILTPDFLASTGTPLNTSGVPSWRFCGRPGAAGMSADHASPKRPTLAAVIWSAD